MVIHVRPATEAAIQEKVESGDYKDADEVIRAALAQLAFLELRRSIQEGIASFERGEGIELTPEVWAEIEREADEMVRRGEQPHPDVCP
ncbi:MAG: type II toxin-antitoxin system ParD family antitoxin [Chloroflexia bacterium]|nr:type II toxin-antitoxin system ParD family antitoxin [Chloroflexia bacterium]